MYGITLEGESYTMKLVMLYNHGGTINKAVIVLNLQF